MIELYAFACGVHELPEDCDAVQLGAVTAVVGDVRGDAMQHGLIVQALVDTAGAVLPARFGERFDDAAALAASVAPRLSELENRLAAVEGCVELAVRVGRPDRTRAEDGGAYMRARLRDANAASALHALLQEQARAAVVTESPLLHDGCYLVDRRAVEDFARTVAAYGDAHPELNLVCTGPWAPASFAEAA